MRRQTDWPATAVATISRIAIVLALAFISSGRPDCNAVVLDSVNQRDKTDVNIIPVPSAAQLRYQSTDFVGKQALLVNNLLHCV